MAMPPSLCLEKEEQQKGHKGGPQHDVFQRQKLGEERIRQEKEGG